jgi:hypothetical protein
MNGPIYIINNKFSFLEIYAIWMLYIKIYVLSNGHGTDLVNSCVPSGRRDRKQNGSYYIDIGLLRGLVA